MPLKIQAISNDSLNRVAVIKIVDVLDDHPRVEAMMKLPMSETQTEAQIHSAIKSMAKAILEEAAHLCR
jgi:hypothetical protein